MPATTHRKTDVRETFIQHLVRKKVVAEYGEKGFLPSENKEEELSRRLNEENESWLYD